MQAERPHSGRAAGPPPRRMTELTPAEAAKEEGNAAMKRSDAAQARRRRAGAEVPGLCRAWCSCASAAGCSQESCLQANGQGPWRAAGVCRKHVKVQRARQAAELHYRGGTDDC